MNATARSTFLEVAETAVIVACTAPVVMGAVAEGNAGDVIAAKLTFGVVAAGLVRRVGVDRTDVILTYRVSTGNGVCRKVARQIPLAHLFTQSLEFFRLKLVEDNGSFGSIVNNTRRRIGNDHIIAKIVDHIFINKMTVIINHNGIRLTGFDGRSILVQIVERLDSAGIEAVLVQKARC